MWLRQYAHWQSVYGTRFGHASMRTDTWCGYASVRIGIRFIALALDTPLCALTLGVATPVCALLALGLWHSLWTRQYVYGTRFGHASMRIDTSCGYANMRIGARFMALALDTPVCALTLGVATPVCALAFGLWHSLWTRQYAH